MLHFQNIKFSLSIKFENLWSLSVKQMLNFNSYHVKASQWAGFLSKNPSRCPTCCDSLRHFLQTGRNNGYFYFVLYTQVSAVEKEAANYYTHTHTKKKIYNQRRLGKGEETRNIADPDMAGYQKH